MRTSMLGLVLLTAFSTFAQMPGSPAGVSAALMRLFETNAFTAKADVRVLDSAQKEAMSMPMDFAVLDNKMRIEADMMQMKSSVMPQGAATELKERGVAQVSSIVRLDKKLTYVIYPNKRAYISVPMSKEDAQAAEKGLKLVKTPLGKETIDGHPCEKHKAVVSSDKAQVLEATIWNATDLGDFPIRIQTNEKENSSILGFKDIQFVKSDPAQFEPPTGYTQYNTQQELMEAGKPSTKPQSPTGK